MKARYAKGQPVYIRPCVEDRADYAPPPSYFGETGNVDAVTVLRGGIVYLVRCPAGQRFIAERFLESSI